MLNMVKLCCNSRLTDARDRTEHGGIVDCAAIPTSVFKLVFAFLKVKWEILNKIIDFYECLCMDSIKYSIAGQFGILNHLLKNTPRLLDVTM